MAVILRGKARRWIAASAAALAVLAVAALFFRADYYLWRMRSAGTSGYELSKMGPSVLPKIYAALRRVGRAPAGDYRPSLVWVAKDIRHDVVAERIGSVLIDDVQVSIQPPDDELVAQVVGAFDAEPASEARANILASVTELDFTTRVRVAVGLLARARSDQERSACFSMLEDAINDAARGPGASSSGVRDIGDPLGALPPAALRARQTAMRRELASRAIPSLVALIEADASGSRSSTLEAATALGPAARFRPDLRPRFVAWVLRARDAARASGLLDALLGGDGPDDLAEGVSLLEQILVESRGAAPAIGALYWANVRLPESEVTRVLCRTLDRAPPDARETIVSNLQGIADTPAARACVDALARVAEIDAHAGGRAACATLASLREAHPDLRSEIDARVAALRARAPRACPALP